MTNGRLPCGVCGSYLRPGRTAGLCDRCAQKLGNQVKKLPQGFYDQPKLQADLAQYEFRRLFIAVLSILKLSQEALGGLVGMSQSQISGVVRGYRTQFTHAPTVAKIANGLGIPTRLLGFDEPESGADAYEEVDWMNRRNFHEALGVILMGIGAGMDLDRLRALLPSPGEERVRRRIGAEDVATIETTTASFRTSLYQRGGGLSRAAAVAQLDHILRLRESRCSEQVHADLQIATAALANTAGWMSCEAGRHEDARQLWMIALDMARQAKHPHSTDLMVEILMNIAQQAMRLGQPRETIDLIRYADATMAMSKYPVSGPTRHYVQDSLALSQAMLGQSEPCLRALDQAAQAYADSDADRDAKPPWAGYSGATAYAAYSAIRGRSLFLLSRTEPGYAPKAIEHLRNAIDGYAGIGYAGQCGLALPALAGSYVQAGDLDAAVTTGHKAVTVIDGLSSTIPHPWLRTLAEVTQPHSHRSNIAELRHRIDEVLTTEARS
jgi:transcriptional regulator with XRE-family HTH domain